MWRIMCGGCGAGQRDDARGLMLVPPLGRCMAHVGGVRQVMPPWLGSWFVPLPAPWCCILVRGGCLGFGHGSVADAVRIVIRWAAVQFVLYVRRHGVCYMKAFSLSHCNSVGGKVLAYALMHGLGARSWLS